MKLLEILDSKIKNFTAHYEDDNPDAITMDVYAKIGNRKINFYGESSLKKDKSFWEVHFAEEDLDDPSTRTHKLTKSGNEFEVFSFIKQCMEIMIDKYDPDIIYFTAEKEEGSNRAKLYEKLLRKNLVGYDIHIVTAAGKVKFVLEKK